MRPNITRLFEARKGHLDYRINRDYIRNGIVTIPCHISDYSDVISPYSVKGYETLNPDFVDFLKENAGLTPEKYPLVLNIIGDNLSQEAKKPVLVLFHHGDFTYGGAVDPLLYGGDM